jgi:hypothetical protein
LCSWQAAIDASQWSLDLQLRYRPPAEIDRARFDLWAARLPGGSRLSQHFNFLSQERPELDESSLDVL